MGPAFAPAAAAAVLAIELRLFAPTREPRRGEEVSLEHRLAPGRMPGRGRNHADRRRRR
jgi:hypothetical protein